jgi:hypothetical protein
MPLSGSADQPSAGSTSTAFLRRVAGLALAVGASLTLASGGVLLIDTLLVLPVVVVQIVVGLRMYRRWSSSAWIGVVCAIWGVWLGLLMTTGIVAPVAWVSVVVNALAVAASIAVAVTTSKPSRSGAR